MASNRNTKRTAGVFVLLALALLGCAKPPFSTIESQIDALKGKPIKAVIDKLGEPTEQSQTGTERAYVWRDDSDVDTALGLRCTIRVFADRNGKVSRYAYDGDVGGCGRYAHALDEKFHRAQGVMDF